MNKTTHIFYLKNCSTCQRIFTEISFKGKVYWQDIKEEKISSSQLDEMAAMAGSYEKLFSRVALKYRAMNLHLKQLNEDDYRNLILQEYTFLKRPVVILRNQIYIGSSKSNIQMLKEASLK